VHTWLDSDCEEMENPKPCQYGGRWMDSAYPLRDRLRDLSVACAYPLRGTARHMCVQGVDEESDT
jgi:hypothetical protein